MSGSLTVSVAVSSFVMVEVMVVPWIRAEAFCTSVEKIVMVSTASETVTTEPGAVIVVPGAVTVTASTAAETVIVEAGIVTVAPGEVIVTIDAAFARSGVFTVTVCR